MAPGDYSPLPTTPSKGASSYSLPEPPAERRHAPFRPRTCFALVVLVFVVLLAGVFQAPDGVVPYSQELADWSPWALGEEVEGPGAGDSSKAVQDIPENHEEDPAGRKPEGEEPYTDIEATIEAVKAAHDAGAAAAPDRVTVEDELAQDPAEEVTIDESGDEEAPEAQAEGEPESEIEAEGGPEAEAEATSDEVTSNDTAPGDAAPDDAAPDDATLDDDSTQGIEEEPTPAPSIMCPTALIKSLSQPSFWQIQRKSKAVFVISPQSHLRTKDPRGPCYSSAVFSARLISPPDTPEEAKTIVALPRPSLSKTDEPSYTLELPEDLVIPSGEYTLEVTLEFGRLPGAMEGSVCGEEMANCGIVGTWKTVETFVGQTLEWERESDATVEIDTDDTSLVDPPPCTDFNTLPGYWLGPTFQPTPSSGPCQLATPAFPVRLASSPPLIWISIVGDSNPRNMFSHLSASFGNGPSRSFFTMSSPTKNGTVSSVAFRSRSGDLSESGAEPDIILTWQWWCQTASANATANIAELAEIVHAPLSTFLSQSELSSAIKSYPTLRAASRTLLPYRSYVSFGSHTEALTPLGLSLYLDALPVLPSYVRFFTTTLVHPANIPLKRFPHQDLIRNNAVIHARNEVLRSDPELAEVVVDVEGLTDGVTQDWTKNVGRTGKPVLDAVHFVDQVYEAWTQLVWSEMML